MTEAIVVVHGGAGTYAPELHDAAVSATRAAAALALTHLIEIDKRDQVDGVSGLDACVEAASIAVRWLELDPTFNAGRGACMTSAGEFEVDAGIMRSRDLANGAVAGVRDLADPSRVARAVMEHCKHALLVGEGARRFAIERDVGTFSREALWTAKAQARFDRADSLPTDNRADTVGAVVRDRRGNLCALGSTGGVMLKLPGRVGDTPLVGLGFYAHPTLGAAVATGIGEAIMCRVSCYELLNRRAQGVDLQVAAEQLCNEIHAADGAAVGFIALDPDPRPGSAVAVAHASEHMSWAIARESSGLDGGLVYPSTRPIVL